MTANPADCAALREVAPELALGILSGPERAEALDHLDHCPDCRALVEELAGATDALVLLAPRAEPPVGFETRVLEAFHGVTRRPRWRELAAWVLAAACVLALAGVLVGRGGGGGSRAELAVLRTASGQEVGRAFLYPARGDHPAWIYLSMPGWSAWLDERGIGESGYHTLVRHHDGREENLGGPGPDARHDGWGGPVDAEPEQVAMVAVVDPDGQVLCSGAP